MRLSSLVLRTRSDLEKFPWARRHLETGTTSLHRVRSDEPGSNNYNIFVTCVQVQLQIAQTMVFTCTTIKTMIALVNWTMAEMLECLKILNDLALCEMT